MKEYDTLQIVSETAYQRNLIIVLLRRAFPPPVNCRTISRKALESGQKTVSNFWRENTECTRHMLPTYHT